jgi:predicted FMN-binding regulatory protein PaiB
LKEEEEEELTKEEYQGRDEERIERYFAEKGQEKERLKRERIEKLKAELKDADERRARQIAELTIETNRLEEEWKLLSKEREMRPMLQEELKRRWKEA